ncbi:TolC family protein [Taibaiella koreensis]|uniref:TolC family protein n=1 Tax=Taibaiella koreensis TaxID=1268548 RepID=UPI0013C2FCDA|nr:TolC family protein [Taibaiella koreensis]
MTRIMKYALWPSLLLSLSLSVQAQEAASQDSLLSLTDAVAAALDQNFDIQIAKVQLDQAKTNNTIGNAGMLPSLNAVGGINGNITDAHVELATGDVQNRKGARSQTLSGAVQLDWILFDGLRMFTNKRRLEELQQIGNTSLKQQIQSTVSQVIIGYAEVVRQKQQLMAIDTAMSLARVRMDLAKKKFEVGTSAKTDYLQAQVDYNASRSALLTQSALLRQAKDSLMIMLGRDQFINYDVQDSLHLNKELVYRDKEQWMDRNFSVQLAQQQKRLSEYDLKLANGAQYPVLDLSASYNYNRTQNGAGVTLFNRTYGPQGGLNLTLPLFNGFNLQRQKKVARQEVFRQDLMVQRLQTSLAARYRTAWRSYDNALKSLDLEKENIGYAEENVMIQQARFRVGVANTLELREAENSYVAAMARLVDASYTVKITETRLLELENNLVK